MEGGAGPKFYGAWHHKLTVYKVYRNLMVPGTIKKV